MVQRLLIKASNNYSDNFQIVPINTLIPIKIPLEIGDFELIINIKNFDGSKSHLPNSLFNVGDKQYLNKSPISDINDGLKDVLSNPDDIKPSNLSFEVNFKPKYPVNGKDFLFGNDFSTPIKDYVPTTLLSAGLKFFNWFINSTVKGDIYNDKPYLYGPILNSCTFISLDEKLPSPNSIKDSSSVKIEENLNKNPDNILKIPQLSLDRKKFFNKSTNCENFVFYESNNYKIKFDTNFIKMSDSHYSVSLPTYNNNTFDINVLSYVNENLNNFNWVMKIGGQEGVGFGTIGLVVNFSLIDE